MRRRIDTGFTRRQTDTEWTEFDENWFPFVFESPDNPYVSSGLERDSEGDDDPDEESDGISDTWAQDEDDAEMEEGEICRSKEKSGQFRTIRWKIQLITGATFNLWLRWRLVLTILVSLKRRLEFPLQ
ncbi:hypothetical protein L2E82_19029 [Cichorium intybus]|uniref:Uncharacterized protein n=1 Tax=Cichorium intybus TaxID=13427 RepID=A0ACB9FB75_CICIN|nr:hypothetical protein L2E82_19029 [Cichorium intybus]